jgi:hypothetical protein
VVVLVVPVVPVVEPEDVEPELGALGGGGGGRMGPGPSAYIGTEAAVMAKIRRRERQTFFMGTSFPYAIQTRETNLWLYRCC